MPHVLVYSSLCHDVATLWLTQAQHIDTSSGSAYDDSSRNLYQHDATYF